MGKLDCQRRKYQPGREVGEGKRLEKGNLKTVLDTFTAVETHFGQIFPPPGPDRKGKWEPGN